MNVKNLKKEKELAVMATRKSKSIKYQWGLGYDKVNNKHTLGIRFVGYSPIYIDLDGLFEYVRMMPEWAAIEKRILCILLPLRTKL